MNEIPNPRWEYRVDDFGAALRPIKKEDLQAQLNTWGQEGWEVVFAFPPEGSARIRVIAKRSLTRADRRNPSMPRLEAI
jgi:hypothetical protein